MTRFFMAFDELKSVSFHCKNCSFRFKASPDSVNEAPDSAHHPFDYFAVCPECGETAGQAAWEKNLLKGWEKATGPRTVAGKAKSSKNLEGHPTRDESKLTRFNAMKHGLSARVATFFPAKPGKYPHCNNCNYFEDCSVEASACLKRTELYLKHQIAFETSDPRLLTEIRSDTQAGIQALINDMILAISQDGGPRIKELQWYHDKDGVCHLARWFDSEGVEHQIKEIKAHPLLRHLIDFISKNSMTLNDFGMTPKSQDEHDLVEGFLDDKGEKRDSLLDFQEEQKRLLEDLGEKIERSKQITRNDPILIEHGESDDS